MARDTRESSKITAVWNKLAKYLHIGYNAFAMLDHRLFLQESSAVFAALKTRGVDAEMLRQLQIVVEQRRTLIQDVEALRADLNRASSEVEQKAKSGQKNQVEILRAQLKEKKVHIKNREEALAESEARFEELLYMVPNLPHATVPVGQSEQDNRVERVVGEPPAFHFTPKAHYEIGETLGILDFARASKISGARFVVLRGPAARLERALINFMLDCARDNGYQEVIPPLLVRPESMVGAGQYPKFIGESFETIDREYVLIPTAEIPLVNLHREEILDASQLPLRYAAYTPCFRREAGAAGRDTRGLIRLHQFNKVELVAYTTPDRSLAELERLTSNAEMILQKLALPYRVVSLNTADLGFHSTKTYDLEVWLPAQKTYREISSCSNCGDFQARRAKIRYRPSPSDKPQFVHTLNGSGLAVGRTLVAILENYQNAEGNVRMPKALISYFGSEMLIS